MKQQIQRLAAFIILIIGISALILLTAAMVNDCISPGSYLFWMAVAGVSTYLDSRWVDKHFVNGEWI